jgi:hypothetical protein
LVASYWSLFYSITAGFGNSVDDPKTPVTVNEEYQPLPEGLSTYYIPLSDSILNHIHFTVIGFLFTL